MVSHPEPEAVLRMCMVAWVMAGPAEVVTYLQQTADDRAARARAKGREAEYLAKTIGPPLSRYVWMRALLEADRLRSEQKAFEAIGQTVERVSIPERMEVQRPG